MHGISLNVAQQMVELQKSLARLLHTRIAELDRRASARHPVRIAAQLEHDGGVTSVEIVDLLANGARLDTVVASINGGRLSGNGLPPVRVQLVGTSEAGTV